MVCCVSLILFYWSMLLFYDSNSYMVVSFSILLVPLFYGLVILYVVLWFCGYSISLFYKFLVISSMVLCNFQVSSNCGLYVL